MSSSAGGTSPTCIVTGANRGVGREVALGLVDIGARVVLLCRSSDAAAALREDIRSATGNESVEAFGVDLADEEQIRAFVSEFLQGHDKLHVLVNNAATYLPTRQVAPSGFELTWATNVLGPYLLTELLLDVMAQTGNHRWRSRVVNLCSRFDGGLESKDTQYESRKYDGVKAYKASKQALRMLTWELDERLPGTGIVANACFPGRVDTSLGRLSEGGLAGFLSRRRAVRPVAVGADTPIWLASSPEVEGVSGGLFFEREEISCKYRDLTACAALGAYCVDQLGLE